MFERLSLVRTILIGAWLGCTLDAATTTIWFEKLGQNMDRSYYENLFFLKFGLAGPWIWLPMEFMWYVVPFVLYQLFAQPIILKIAPKNRFSVLPSALCAGFAFLPGASGALNLIWLVIYH